MRVGNSRGRNGKKTQAPSPSLKTNGFFASMPVGLVHEIVKKTPDRKTLKTLKNVNRFFRVILPKLEEEDYFSELKLIFARPVNEGNFNLLGTPSEKMLLSLETDGSLALFSCSNLGFNNSKNYLTDEGLAYEYMAETSALSEKKNGFTVFALAVKKSASVPDIKRIKSKNEKPIFQFSLKPEDCFIIGVCEVSKDSKIRLAMNSTLANPPFFDLQTKTDIDRGKNVLVQDFVVQAERLKKLVPNYNDKRDIEESEMSISFFSGEEDIDTTEELPDDEPFIVVVLGNGSK